MLPLTSSSPWEVERSAEHASAHRSGPDRLAKARICMSTEQKLARSPELTHSLSGVMAIGIAADPVGSSQNATRVYSWFRILKFGYVARGGLGGVCACWFQVLGVSTDSYRWHQRIR